MNEIIGYSTKKKKNSETHKQKEIGMGLSESPIMLPRNNAPSFWFSPFPTTGVVVAKRTRSLGG